VHFEWDEQKNDDNVLKHDLDFEDASEVFAGPLLTMSDTRQDYGEVRWIGIGFLEARIVVVVFTRREPDIIRVISMRKATHHEQQRFAEDFKNQLGSP